MNIAIGVNSIQLWLIRNKYFFAGITVYTCICLYFLRGFIFAGNPAIPNLGGDTIKSIFVYLYYISYGHGVWFTGMNYPAGEHLFFTDGQPLISLILAKLQPWLRLSFGQLLYLLYSLIGLSMVIGMHYTSRVLRHYAVHPVFAIVLAGLIGITSPQIYRATGHFSLSYATFLPMLLWWTIRYYETNRKSFLLKICLLFTAYSLLHLYFLAMALMWALLYAVGTMILRKTQDKTIKPLRHALWMIAPALATLALMQGIVLLTDPIKDRPSFPYAEPYTMFPGLQMITNSYSPIWRGLATISSRIELHDPGEGVAYLGIVPLIILCLAVLAFVFTKKNSSPFTASASGDSYPRILFFIAAGSFVFAVSIKYFWNYELLRPITLPFRQFRAAERFTWITCYILTVFSGIVLYHFCRHIYIQRQKRIVASLIVILAIGIWGIDAKASFTYMRGYRRAAGWMGANFLELDHDQAFKDILNAKGYNSEDFQGIIALPYVHVGSEKIWPGEDKSYCMTLAYKAALHLHLPIVDVMMGRSSWSQTFESVRIAGGPYADQGWLARMSDKPLLLLHWTPDDLSPDELALMKPGVADTIGRIRECRILAFYPHKFLAFCKAQKDSAALLSAGMQVADSIIGTSLPVYINHFESQHAAYHFTGKGAASPISTHDSTFANLHFATALPADTTYEFSAWARFPEKYYYWNYYRLVCLDTFGNQLSIVEPLGKYSVDNAAGLWFRVSKYFTVPAGTSDIEMRVVNPDGQNYLSMDDVLLRPAKALVISKLTDGSILANNHRLQIN